MFCFSPQNVVSFDKFILIHLRAKQVSKANLLCEQGVINFIPFLLSLPYAKKKLKFPIWIGVSSKMSVCLLSVVVLLSVCYNFFPNYLLHRWSDWAKLFLQKLEKIVYLQILILKSRDQDPRVKALG